MVGSSKGWWESADGWRDEAGGTEWCEGEALITRGGGDHAASLRNEFDDVKTEVKNMKEDIKGIVPMFEKTMKVMEENLHLAKEEICGAKARMEMLEADIKKVVQTDDRGIPAVVAAPPQPAPVVRAPQSPVVTARESAPVERAPHSPALSAPESEPVVTKPCGWHKHKPDSCVELDYAGVEEKDVDDWINHLGSTLFARNTKPLLQDAETHQTRVARQVPSNSLQNQGQPLLPRAMHQVSAVRLRKIWHLGGRRISHGTKARYEFADGLLHDRGGR